MKHFRVLGSYVLIQLIEESKTHGGIIVPDNAKESASLSKGTVISKGPGFLLPSFTETDDITSIIEQSEYAKVRYVPLDINEGDTVYFSKERGEPVILEGKSYIIIPYSAIRLCETL